MNIKIKNETGRLKSVILGIPPKIMADEKNHDDFTERDIKQNYEIKSFKKVLVENGVEVVRPKRIKNIEHKLQIFTRDIGFVIDKYFIKGNMRVNDRAYEFEALKDIIKDIDKNHILTPPPEADIEGGDVILWNDYIFVGLSARTNYRGYEFIKKSFPDKEVIPFEVYLSSDERRNILHLDCTFQPIGKHHALIYDCGFERPPDPLYDLFKEKNLIRVHADEAFHLATNVFSISEDLLVSEKGAKRVNNELRKAGFKVIEVPYYNVIRCGGSFRCSTLPLERK